MKLSPVTRVLCALVSFALAAPVWAQSYHQDYAKLIRSDTTIEPVGDGMFGDNVNLYTGKTKFEAVDLSVPGNNAIPVEVRRSYDVENRHVVNPRNADFGDWELEIPRIEAIFPANDVWTDAQRCTNFGYKDQTAIAQDWTNSTQIVQNNNWTGVKGIVGQLYSNPLPAAVIDPSTLVSGTAGTISVQANQTSLTGLGAGIVELQSPFPDAVVAMRPDPLTSATFLILKVRTAGLTNIPVRYRIRDLDTSTTNGARQSVALQYRIGISGDFANISEGYVLDATNTGTTPLETTVNAVLPAAANNQAEVQLRIITTNSPRDNGTGTASEWIGIDDIAVGGVPLNAPVVSSSREPVETWGEPARAATDFSFSPDEFAQGFRLIVPGKTNSELLTKLSGLSMFPSDVSVVTNGYWLLKCESSNILQTPDSGQGFTVLSPDGMRYKFNRLVQRPYPNLTRPTGFVTRAPLDPFAFVAERAETLQSLDRVQATMLVTRVDDRFGNWVEFDYNNNLPSDPQVRRQLIAIRSSDGRRIDLNWFANRVADISAGTRTHSYTYNPTNKSLERVNLADGSRWTYNFTALSNAVYSYATSASCATLPAVTGPASITATIGHPSGLNATYTFKPVRHEIANVPSTCLISPGGTQFARVNPNAYDTITMTQKSVNGFNASDSDTRTWRLLWPTTSLSTKVVEREGPESQTERFTFGNQSGIDDGLLTRFEILNSGRHTEYEYLPTTTGPYPAQFGTSFQTRGDSTNATTLRLLKKKSTLQQGRWFTYEQTNMNVYGNPVLYTRGTRQTSMTYSNLTTSSKWILQSPLSATTGSLVEFTHTLDANLLPLTISNFGKLNATLTYDATGLLASVKDGRNNITNYSNYHRGVPRTIDPPLVGQLAATVDDFGNVTSVTDELSRTTNYAFDDASRLTLVDPPLGDSTTIAYTRSTNQQLTATATTGARVSATLYNAHWQPLSKNTAGRTITYGYDRLGRLTFSSYPNKTIGTTYSYNLRDELTQESAASELGALITTYEYLDQFQTRITNPRNFATTIAYQSFDAPVRNAPVSITEPLGRETTISRDIFGKPLAVVRNGQTTTLSYDTNQRLCLVREPGVGGTSYRYDASNNVDLLTQGTAINSCVTTAGAQSTVRVFDARNRLTDVDYPGDEFVTNQYLADGRLEWAQSQHGLISYTYNTRGQLTSETHQVKPSLGTYLLSYAYNNLGHLSSTTYPDGSVVAHTPNVFGEATTAGTFATNVTRFNNGAVSGFKFGNNINRTIAINDRFLPTAITDGSVMSLTYSYDKNANPTNISGIAPNLTLDYDALDRLSAQNNAAYTYDLLDNITKQPLSGGDATIAYTNQLPTSVTRNGIAQTITHDDRGNVTARGNLSFSYDGARQMTRATFQSGGPADRGTSHGYNSLGKRIFESSYCGHVHTVYGANGKLMWQQFNVAIPATVAPIQARLSCFRAFNSRKYVYVDSNLVAEVETSSTGIVTTYKHTDLLGSPRVTTNATGSSIGSMSFDAFGIGGSEGSYGFAGHFTDDLGLIYMGARHYDPLIGRFLSIDPVMMDPNTGANWNRYAYANNSPYKFVDPDGRENVLGIVATFEDYSRIDSPSARDTAGLADVQRSVDLTVETVIASGDADVIADAKVWEVTYNPEAVYAEARGTIAATTSGGEHGSEDNPRYIATAFLKPFDALRKSTGNVKTSEGITSSTKDAKLLVTGLHELSHGSKGNSEMPYDSRSERAASERDIGQRVRELIKDSPTVDRNEYK